MIYISNLGNLSGKVSESEGSLKAVYEAVQLGFYVRIPVWKLPNALSIGVQYPIERVSLGDLSHCICQAMTVETFQFLLRNKVNCYWRESDTFSITNNGIILSFGSVVLDGSVVMEPELCLMEDILSKPIQGICSDYISTYVRK